MVDDETALVALDRVSPGYLIGFLARRALVAPGVPLRVAGAPS